MMATETRCGDGSNDWPYAESTWSDMHTYLSGGVNAYMQWNMILDHVGKSSYWVGFKQDFWAQSSMITINTRSGEVVYNPQFYAVKHFSHYILPGAYRIHTAEDLEEVEAIGFVNPDGSVVLQLWNGAGQEGSVNVALEGRVVTVQLPAHAFSTIIF